MLNPQNIFCELIDCENANKNDNTPRFICEKDISLIVRPSWKNHNLDHCLANKISKTDVNQQNILII